jgi:colicin import membrane protein
MAEMEKEQYRFPDEAEDQGKPLEQVEEEQRQEADGPELEIEIEDDTPPEDRGREPTPREVVQKLEVDVSELDQYSEDAKKKMIQMKKIWNDERRAREAAEREQNAAVDAAKRLREENERIKTMLSKGEQEYVAAMKTTADLQLEMAKRAYKESYDNGDSEGMMNAQQAITNATLQLDRVNNFKMPPLQEKESVVQTQEQYQPAARPDDKVMAWQSRNSWFGQDEEMTASALGLHEKLKRQGVVVGSDEYYAALDRTMRKRFPENFDEDLEMPVPEEVREVKAADKPATKPSTVVAPATRSTASKKIRLKTSQVAIAKKLGLTPEQYVRELMKLEA